MCVLKSIRLLPKLWPDQPKKTQNKLKKNLGVLAKICYCTLAYIYVASDQLFPLTPFKIEVFGQNNQLMDENPGKIIKQGKTMLYFLFKFGVLTPANKRNKFVVKEVKLL